MQPIEFEESNTVFAKNQKEYQPLPAYIAEDGTVVSRWQLSLKERFKLLFQGKLYISVLTFSQPLQPLLPTIRSPFSKEAVGE